MRIKIISQEEEKTVIPKIDGKYVCVVDTIFVCFSPEYGKAMTTMLLLYVEMTLVDSSGCGALLIYSW